MMIQYLFVTLQPNKIIKLKDAFNAMHFSVGRFRYARKQHFSGADDISDSYRRNGIWIAITTEPQTVEDKHEKAQKSQMP